MMSTKFSRVLLVAILSISLGSCDDAALDPPQNTGKIVGWITIEDTDCNGKSGSLAGVEVSLIGTAHQTQTDVGGRWELTDVPAGSYDVAYERADIAKRVTYSVQFAGNGRAVFPQVNLQPAPDQRVLQILATKLLWYSDLIKIKFDSTITEDLVFVNGEGELDTLLAGTLIDSGTIIAKPTYLKAIKLDVALAESSSDFRFGIAYSDKAGPDPRDLRTITGFGGGTLKRGERTLIFDADWMKSWSNVRTGKLFITLWGSSCDPRIVRDPETGIESYTGIADVGSNEISLVID